jgi:eukaryotic-like serine/threonine-protein kinase
MKKFQLSKQYRFTTADDLADSSSTITAQLKNGERYGLLDTASGECIIINETMYQFLKQYETPTTLEEVAQFFAATFDSTLQEVLPVVKQFFKEMKERSVILNPQKVERYEIIKPYTVGTLVDHYRIEKNLSINLPLEVYKATDTRNEQLVILKLLRIPTHLSPKQTTEWRKKFRKEFKIQKILRGHPNICQLLDLKLDYAVSEWIEAISIRRRIDEGVALTAALRDVLLGQIIDAYAFMHYKNILHGDVHFSNILLSNDTTIKVIDFDLAHRLTDKKDSPSVRGGMPDFIPPENIHFNAFEIVKGKANYRTEVYQLGVITYWLTYGKLPFIGDTWQDMATNILKEDIDFPTLSASGDPVSPKMVDFLKKSLAKKAKNRFTSAVEMNKAFKKLIK